MINIKYFSILPVLLLSLTPPAFATDPFAAVEHIQMPNGLQIFLAPSKEATLTSIRLEVGVGTQAEEGDLIGVSHLLEHVLFRDKNLADEMSYLQLIKEAGGSANGSTNYRETAYFGSIPAAKGTWLFETFSKMILQPNFEDRYVQKEKSTIELERGRPSPIEETIGFSLWSLLRPSYLDKKGFWESEFNYPSNKDYTLLQEQLSTRKLTAEQVENHYHDYYYAKNMKLYIAGKFDRAQIIKEIDKNWRYLQATEGKILPPLPTGSPRKSPYVRTSISPEPNVSLGSKIWGATAEETAVLESFSSYLAHRMMKEIRNSKGQTYTAYDSNNMHRGAGYISVSFVTPKEFFKENLKIARDYFDEGRNGKVSEAHVKEALNLAVSEYNLRGKEAEDMLKTAKAYADQLTDFGSFQSPYAALLTMTPEKYNQILTKHLVPEMKYESLTEPPLFFHYDQYLLYALSLVFIFMGFRALLTQQFQHDKIRWVRKVAYPSIKIAEGIAFAIAIVMYLHVQYLVDLAFEKDFMQKHIFTSQYLYIVVSVFALLAVAQGVYSLMPRKLMVHDQALWIKSVTYYSQQIPLSEISKVEDVRLITSPSLKLFWAIKYRFYNFSPKFWKKGLAITLKNGKAYYFSMNDAGKAAAELKGLMQPQPSLDRLQKAS
ncbi:hypothetical protein AZI86_00385 [Bdellovibrio bacteriovorus]|uniref:Insulinase family protein n=1 Tax=Bdellovibrio bacteriovorus TaxID=959 RepID=A0A150WM51_BDEBC|nr:insulinase family protein [Bdellovibrio bacteriovorus]KYG65573.1 hypothetical protein AZI86_00385 [Bdellovibrio bacteriovorus]